MTTKHIASVLLAATIIVMPRTVYAQFTPFSDRKNQKVILEGNWQSCQLAYGIYNEQIFDYYDIKRKPIFEFHMGPENEFALFKGIQDEHRDHNLLTNLLRIQEAKIVENQGNQQWNIPSLNLHIAVVLTSGSRDDCQHWWVVLESLKSPAS